MNELILNTITDFYLNSGDFNGIHINALISTVNIDWLNIKSDLEQLIKNDFVRIIDEATDINPNIIRLGFEDIDTQIQKIQTAEPGYICLYPTKSVLSSKVNIDNFKTEPYKLRLALGEAQLASVPFDLSVLEFYRNDPRYRYENDDIQGQIYYVDVIA